MEYLDTDTICFPGDKPKALVRLQKEHWDPLREWLKEEFGVELGVTTGFDLPKHGENAREKLRGILSAMPPWELAAFERAVYATKSFAIALALVKGKITANQAAEAAHAEVQAQIEQWGEVEDSEWRICIADGSPRRRLPGHPEGIGQRCRAACAGIDMS